VNTMYMDMKMSGGESKFELSMYRLYMTSEEGGYRRDRSAHELPLRLGGPDGRGRRRSVRLTDFYLSLIIKGDAHASHHAGPKVGWVTRVESIREGTGQEGLHRFGGR
jgi:hypothetical protein